MPMQTVVLLPFKSRVNPNVSHGKFYNHFMSIIRKMDDVHNISHLMHFLLFARSRSMNKVSLYQMIYLVTSNSAGVMMQSIAVLRVNFDKREVK
jgi:hypothetical protein